MAFQWTTSLSVGVSVIDEQHKEIFARVNKLLDATSRGKGKEEIGQTLDFLGKYVVAHFGAEEARMRDANYPEAAAHKKQHEQFLRDFTALSGQFDREGASAGLVIAVQHQVCDWLITHIGKTDKALGSFLMQAV